MVLLFLKVHVLFMMWVTRLKALCQVRSQESLVEKENNLSWPAGYTAFDADRDAFDAMQGLCGLQGHISGLCCFSSSNTAKSSSGCSQSILYTICSCMQVKKPAIGLAGMKFLQFHLSKLLWFLCLSYFPLPMSTAPHGMIKKSWCHDLHDSLTCGCNRSW